MEDTRPRNPFHEQQPPPQEDDTSGGPGCFVWGCFSLFAMGLSIAIVALSGAAGWTEGHRVADKNATATQSNFINEQLRRIPTDIANGNEYLLQVRLDFLQTLTPGVPQVAQIQAAATALHLNNLPTSTAVPSSTPEITTTPLVEVTEVIEVTALVDTGDESGFDLGAMLEEARVHGRFGEYEEAYELLDIIIRVDPDYQRSTVRALANEALVAQAAVLYRTPDTVDLAEAIRLTDLAEQYGSIGELDYERTLAGLYLDVMRMKGTGDHAYTINLLNSMRVYQTEYKGISLNNLLFDEYVAYGDAWGFGGQYCEAVSYYNQALSLFNSQTLQTKRDDAQLICENGTPTPVGDVPAGEVASTPEGS